MVNGAYYSASGSAVLLSTLIPKGNYRQVDLFGNAANAASFFIGSSTVTSAGVNAYIEIEPGKAWGSEFEQGADFYLNSDELYVVGTASDKLHIVYVK